MDIQETVAALGDDATIVSTKEIDTTKSATETVSSDKLKKLADDMLTNNIVEVANNEHDGNLATTTTTTSPDKNPSKNGSSEPEKLNEASSSEDKPKPDDVLIQELKEIEGLKKTDDLPSVSLENTDSVQKTSDLLKDLEDDIQDDQVESHQDIGNAAVKELVDAKNNTEKIAATDKTIENEMKTIVEDNGEVDSTTDRTLKRKHSTDSYDLENVCKKPNVESNSENIIKMETTVEKSSIKPEATISSTSNDATAKDEVKISAKLDNATTTEEKKDSADVAKKVTEDITSTDDKGSEKKIDTPNSKPIVDAIANVDSSAEIVSENNGKDEDEKMEVDNVDESIDKDKLLKKVDSSPSTTAAVVFNSAANKKDSENVSKISESTDFTVPKSNSDSSSENLDKHTKYNGLTDAVNDENDDSVESPKEKQSQDLDGKSKANGTNVSAAKTIEPKVDIFDLHILYEGNELTFMSIDNVERKKQTTEIAAASELSNKSVASTEPLALLDSKQEQELPSTISSEASTETFATPVTKDQRRIKKTIEGMVALCNFMIDHFSQIKNRLEPFESDDEDDHHSTPVTATKRGRKPMKKTDDEITTPKSAGKRGAPKRPLDKSASDAEDESKAKQGKSSTKKQSTKPEQIATKEEDTKVISCLARWVDKKYYPGRVTGTKPGNKFVVLFADGATKILPQESIVFGGEDDILPLLNHSVHARVSEDTYEPGVVESTNKEDDTIYYTVQAESKTVKVTSADIYLEEDQAKAIRSKESDLMIMKTPETPSSKRTGRPSTKYEDSQTSSSRGRPKKIQTESTTPEPSTSGTRGGGSGTGSGRKGRNAKRPEPPPPLTRFSESSDLSDNFELDIVPPCSPEYALEAVGGVEPELQQCPQESEIDKRLLIAEYLGHDHEVNVEDILGPLPDNRSIFRNKHFILTCTLLKKNRCRYQNGTSSDQTNGIEDRELNICSLPFVKYHLQCQIEAGGGKVYDHFEDIPKSKYKLCKLIAPEPCATAKYVQCLAANIMAISHEWIIQSCSENELKDSKSYALPSGWSIIENRFKRWKAGKGSDFRSSLLPFSKTCVILASYQKQFTEFWTRVFKLAGGTVRLVKSVNDLTPTTEGIIMVDDEFPDDIRSKALFLNIPIVSTVWAVQSLILGEACDPNSNVKFQQMYLDDD